jgi:hypothetical protein
VASIGEFAFAFNPNLINVTIGASTPPQILSSSIFVNTGVESGSGRIINVPTASVSLYESAVGWADFTFVAAPPSCFTTTPNQSGLTILGYSCNQSVVNIPSQINNISVTAIGESAFANKNILGIDLPNSVTSIGNFAFANNINLTHATIIATNPPTISSSNIFIHTGVESGSGRIINVPTASVGLYESATGWSDFTFFVTPEACFTHAANQSGVSITGYSCTDAVVVIPGTLDGISVTEIGVSAFKDKGLSSVTLPNSVISIDKEAFRNNQLTSLTIPNSVANINFGAFAFNSLGSLDLGNGLSNIGIGAFAFNQLTSLVIPNNVTTISRSAFYNNLLTSVTLPDSITSIDIAVFANNKLSSISIPDSVTSIGIYAFDSNQLESIVIPNNVTSLAGFSNNKLTQVTIPSNVTSIGQTAFYGNQLTSITIPDSVTSIGASAFESNQLTSLVIPSGVAVINSFAFSQNPLTQVTVMALTPPQVEDISIFASSPLFNHTNNSVLFVPANALSLYQDSPVWSFFNLQPSQ